MKNQRLWVYIAVCFLLFTGTVIFVPEANGNRWWGFAAAVIVFPVIPLIVGAITAFKERRAKQPK